ncbi:succinate-semialdehyde dehydrogenase [Vibrio sp. qd031]|nr:succinate-semialdehyde dehydrogenase [Vibrio sp. qd031]
MQWIAKLEHPQMLNVLTSQRLEPLSVEVLNPATQKSLGWLAADSLEQVESKIVAATLAQPKWAAQTAKYRSKLLRKWFDLIEHHQQDLALIMTMEQGKPLSEAASEVAYGAAFVEWFAEEAKRAYGMTIPATFDGKSIRTIKQPIGVCASITPWNFPVAMLTRKLAPALAAGCAMVSKPAINTPLCAIALRYLALKAGIDGDLLPIVISDQASDVGLQFCTHPNIRKLSFTGSTAVGKQLMRQSSQQVQRVSMELGGNAPFIVFADADINEAVAGAIVCKFRNAGQTCVCANRFYIHDSVYEEFAQKLHTAMSKLSLGAGVDGHDIGPLIDEKALQKVHQLVHAATLAGADLVCGGNVASDIGALFYQPTLLSNVAHDNPVMKVEQFGPIAALCRFSDIDEALQFANDTEFGLASYFFTQDVKLAEYASNKLEYGIVGINEGIISTEVAPFGGIKHSGVGREGSALGLDEYLETKYIAVGGLR